MNERTNFYISIGAGFVAGVGLGAVVFVAAYKVAKPRVIQIAADTARNQINRDAARISPVIAPFAAVIAEVTANSVRDGLMQGLP